MLFVKSDYLGSTESFSAVVLIDLGGKVKLCFMETVFCGLFWFEQLPKKTEKTRYFYSAFSGS